MVTLVAASLAIITLDYRGGDRGPLAEAGRAIESALAPLQRATSNVVQPISNFFSDLADLPRLSARNDELQRQLEDAKTAIQENQELEQEVTGLQDLLDLQGVIHDLKPMPAAVIASGVSNFEWTVTIDRGSNDGIQPDMAVVTGDESGPRLVGRIVRVTPVSSVVQLLVDRNFSVAGQLLTSHEAGIVEGRGEEDLRMDLLAPGTSVSDEAPEPVFTLGYEANGQPSIYPRGLLIGTVSRAFSSEDAVEAFVTLRPAVDVSTLRYVLVLRTKQRSAAQP